MEDASLRELINQDKLQCLQDEFCLVTGTTVYCLDGNRNKVTDISGTQENINRIRDNIVSTRIEELLERVADDSLEEQAVEECEEMPGRMAAIAIRVEERTLIYWLLFDTQERDSTQFYQIVDLLRDASQSVFGNKFSCYSAEIESRRSRYAQQEMIRTIRVIEATTQIVQLLDSDEPVERIINQWLTILAQHLEVDTAEVFQIYGAGNEMDVISEWCRPGLVSLFDRTSRQPTYSFLQTETPLVMSADSVKAEYQRELEHIGMRAVMIFPILCQENGTKMILSLNHRKEAHNWNMSEIKYASDAVKVLHSIVTRRVQKHSLAGSYAALESILDNVGCAIYVKDAQKGNILFANKRLQSTFAIELKDNSFQSLVEDDNNREQGGDSYEVYHSRSERWYDLLYKDIAWVDGRRAILYSLYDITDKKLYQRKIEQQAYTDFLTGLYNRMCCERDLARQIDQTKKSGEIGALLYLDLDDFKHINDGLGHQYGDVLLKSISHSLRSIEGIENTCYRMGGDEFVIVIPPNSYKRFDAIIESIKSIFNKPWFLKDADYYCTMSMGIVTFPDAGDSVEDLIKKADIAMYEAKKSGKNRFARYNAGTDSASGKRLDMEKNMRDATVDGYKEFEVYYQPILNIQKQRERCVGAEALIRWNSSKLGFVSPAEFIPLAEYLGLINPIGNHVLKVACQQCKFWNDNGYPDYKVNVNLSVVQLLQADVVEIVERTLKETGIHPANLTLEVTESLAINDMERMKEILNRIKALGVMLALDDFGTGYSSLNHIREIPFDVIKVDQSFVKDLAEDAYSQSFIKLVAELAETIDMSVCVEGIETTEQFKVLQDMKVTYIQGYYFDKPMQRKDFEKKYAPKVCRLADKVLPKK